MPRWVRAIWDKAKEMVLYGQDWSRRHLPPGVRLLVGLLLICAGFLWILPFFGIWMLPLGVAIAALDVAPILRWIRGRRRRPSRRGDRE